MRLLETQAACERELQSRKPVSAGSSAVATGRVIVRDTLKRSARAACGTPAGTSYSSTKGEKLPVTLA